MVEALIATKSVQRPLLSLSLIRFINGILESKQQGAVAQSLLTLADQMQVPRWLVELRHRATHDKHLPGTSVLIEACETSLLWLKDRYWDLLLEEISVGHDPLLLNALRDWKDVRKRLFKSVDISMELDAQSTTLLDAIFERVEDKQQLASALVYVDGFLVPMSKKKRCTMTRLHIDQDMLHLWRPVFDKASSLWSTGFLTSVSMAILDVLTSPDGTSFCDRSDVV